jgi:hypothetical protein
VSPTIAVTDKLRALRRRDESYSDVAPISPAWVKISIMPAAFEPGQNPDGSFGVWLDHMAVGEAPVFPRAGRELQRGDYQAGGGDRGLRKPRASENSPYFIWLRLNQQ